MATDRKKLREFRQAHFDYLEGSCVAPPSLDTLDKSDRKAAQKWIESLETARGVDPYASRPSTSALLARAGVSW